MRSNVDVKLMVADCYTINLDIQLIPYFTDCRAVMSALTFNYMWEDNITSLAVLFHCASEAFMVKVVVSTNCFDLI